MLKTRVIPCLLLNNGRLVKTKKFKDHSYIGDPINTIRIFNEKEVCELFLLDIGICADPSQNLTPDYDLIKNIASECFMPVAYGGGIKSIEQIKTIFSLGIEKVVLNSHFFSNPDLLEEAAAIFGSQSIVFSMNVKKNFWGKYETYANGARKAFKIAPDKLAQMAVDCGAGELLVNSIDRDGTYLGYDLELMSIISATVDVPIVALGGAGCTDHFRQVVQNCGVSGVAAGSLFVYKGTQRAVLINYPKKSELESCLCF